MNREVLFKLRYPTGEWVVIHTDGYVDGVPPGTVILSIIYIMRQMGSARATS